MAKIRLSKFKAVYSILNRHGTRGMVWESLEPLVETRLRHFPSPGFLLIHLGGNDIVQSPAVDLILNVKATILNFWALMPHKVIIWSDILVWLCWHLAKKSPKVDSPRKRINSTVRSFVVEEGGRAISHPSLTVKDDQLFRTDRVHLDDPGNAIFLNTIQGAISKFLKGVRWSFLRGFHASKWPWESKIILSSGDIWEADT